MRFLVIAPRYVNKVGQYYEFPLGLAYVSASLKKAGYDVACLNLNQHDESLDVLLERAIVDKGIDVACIGGLSIHFGQIRTILNITQKIKPDIITMVGGGLLSSEPELIMNALKADFGVIGEGEETIVEIADAIAESKDFSSIKGIIYYDSNNNLVTTSKRDPVKNLDSIPYPDYEGFEVDKYLDMQMPNDNYYMYPFDKPRLLPLISSRSCPYSCTFCFHPLGKKYRQRSLDGFFAEVEYLIDKYNINMIAVLDELFSAKKERIKEFCKRIKKYNLKWIAQMRVDSVDEKTLLMLKDAGCFCISYGLESASNTILESMKKKIKVSDIEKALDYTCRAKIGIQGNFIFGDKEETWETANETLKWWLEHRKYQIFLALIYAYPGTELYYYAVEKGIIRDKLKFIENGCPSLNWSKMNEKEYADLNTMIFNYTIDNPVQAELVSSKNTGRHTHKGELYTINIKCPHCNSKITYKNIHKNGFKYYDLLPLLHCRVCNQRFTLPFDFDLRVIDRINSIITKSRSKKLAAWGASQLTRLLFHFIPSFREHTVCIFDNDTKKHGMLWDGIRVVPFPADHKNLKLTVEDILITSKDFEGDIYNQISHLKDYGVNVHRLFGYG